MALSVVQTEVPEIQSEISSSALKNAVDSANSSCCTGQSKDRSLRNCWNSQNTDDDESEVDSLVDLKAHRPIHIELPLGPTTNFESQSSATMLKPRLTLSAFRGPAANMTKTDPSRKLQDYYDLDRPGCSGVLGHGAFSTVRLALRKCDSIPVAVKTIAKHEALRSRRLRPGRHLEEWEILTKMRGHQFIIQLLDVFETEEEIQLVLEYCAGGELFNAIQRKRNRSFAMRRGQYSEEQAACIINQILRALSDLHSAGVVHRDLKPENILLASDNENSVRVKLCDFGMARSILQNDHDCPRQGDGSPLTPELQRPSNATIGGSYYIAPELHHGSSYDTAIDMYSLGVTLYIVLCGFPPVFSGPDADEVMFPIAYWKDISEDAKNLVRRMLHPAAAMRITADKALRDRWIWKHRSSFVQALSPMSSSCRLAEEKAKIMINLDIVRRRLTKKAVPARGMKRRTSCENVLLSPKRQRLGSSNSSASTALMALADLYRDVVQSPSAKVISSVVDHNSMDGRMPFKKSPLPTLSV